MKRIAPLVLAALIGASTLAVGASLAQTPLPMEADPLDDRSKRRLDRMEQVLREIRSIVFQGRNTGKPVAVHFVETDVQLQAVVDRVSDLEASLTRLNGANETLAHELEQTRRALQTAQSGNEALVARLRALEAVAAAQAAAQAEEAAAAAEDPEVAFGRARQYMLDGDYAAAEDAFGRFVDLHGDSPRGAEAQYWLGKTLSARGAHADAATAYIGAIRGWPKTTWAPDAVVELSRSLMALKKPADACKTLDELAARYPQAPAAVKSRATTARAQAKCAA